MTEPKRFSLIKPTVDTPYHIDFDWWSKNDNDWHVHLRDLLCPAHRETFAAWDSSRSIDWIDPETAEVRQLDGLQHTLMSHCARNEEFLAEHVPMVDAVFRVLLSGGNVPLTSRQLSLRLNRPAETILRTISGITVYKGIRPVQN